MAEAAELEKVARWFEQIYKAIKIIYQGNIMKKINYVRPSCKYIFSSAVFNCKKYGVWREVELYKKGHFNILENVLCHYHYETFIAIYY